jgi:N-acetylmuramic acid 6-phosphate etherase
MKQEEAGPWQGLLTELRNPRSRDLDTLPTEDVVTLMLEEDRRGLDTALAQRQGIAQAAEWFAEALAAGGKVVFAGAGTSGRLGVLEASECPPTFGTRPEQIQAVMAGGPEAVFRSREGAEDSEPDGREAVANLEPRDLLIGISASSVTPFARGALAGARGRGARTVLLTCASGEGLGEVADLVLALETGPEILTGSTRLKAGSATKAALNAISTAAMVRLGKVFENLMVDVHPGSAKLRDRALRILAAAALVSRQEAVQLLERAGGSVKVAIVMERLELSPAAAAHRLEACGGSVRRALEAG